MNYSVYIRHVDGTSFSTDVANCDGSNSVIMASTLCFMPIATLRASPFSLDWGDSVNIKVVATNIVGNSLESSVGNGAIILTRPDAPTTLANDVSLTSSTKIAMTWVAGAADGGTPVIDYRVSYALKGNSLFSVL